MFDEIYVVSILRCDINKVTIRLVLADCETVLFCIRFIIFMTFLTFSSFDTSTDE